MPGGQKSEKSDLSKKLPEASPGYILGNRPTEMLLRSYWSPLYAWFAHIDLLVAIYNMVVGRQPHGGQNEQKMKK